MQFRTKVLLDSMKALQALSQKEEFEPKIRYKIAKIISKMEPEEKMYNKHKDELVKKYGKTDDKGQIGINAKDDPKAYEDFIHELEIVQDEDVEVVFNSSGNDIIKIKPDELCDNKGMQVDFPSAWLVPLLGWLVDDEEDI